MPNHFTSLGFPVGSVSDFAKLSSQTARNGTSIETDAGTYRRWVVGGGPQLWVHLNHDKKIMGFDPHFVGPSRMRVRLTQRVKQPKDTVLEGAFSAWSNPWTNGPYGDTLFVFHVPDFARHDDLQLPVDKDVQLAAFAHTLSAYANDAEFFNESPEGRAKFAAEAFIASGMLTPKLERIDPPQPQAVFGGHVLRTSVLTNPVTGLDYHWAQVHTLIGDVDVIVDPEVLKGTLVVGGVVSGGFWLSGQIIEPSEDRVL